MGRRVGLPPVAVGLHFPVGREVLVVHGALHFPHGLAGLFVERDDELVVAPVVMIEEQSVPDDRRAPRATVVIAHKVAPLPHDRACLCVNARGGGRAPACVKSAVLDHRRRRRVAVELVAKLRLLDFEKHLVVQHFSRGFVERHHAEFLAVLGRRREPHFVAPDDRRRPRLAVRRGFPFHIHAFAELEWERLRIAVPVAVRPAELRPVLFGVEGKGEQGCGEEELGRSHGCAGINRARRRWLDDP